MVIRPRRYIVVSTALVAVGACALPSVDEYAAGSATSIHDAGHAKDGGLTSDARDGSLTDTGSVVTPPHDAGGDTDALPPPPPPIVNLLPKNQNDFELGNCDDSGHYESELFGSDAEHSGSYSCKVCRAAASPNAYIWSIDNGVPPAVVGKEYRASVWVRRPTGASDALVVHLALRTHDDAYNPIDQIETSGVTLTDTWQQLSLSLTITKSAPGMDTYTFAENKDGLVVPCFLVDDYVVWQAN